MKSDPTAQCFSCNYDTGNPKSGVVYTAVLTQCIAGTQDKKVCGDLYTDWLQGKVTDKRNLLLRALCLNHDLLAEEIDKASKASVTWGELSWDKLMGIGKIICSGWGLIFVGLMFFWAFFSMLFVNNKIQDWLELTYWGVSKNPNAKYRSTEMEMQQLDIAVKG